MAKVIALSSWPRHNTLLVSLKFKCRELRDKPCEGLVSLSEHRVEILLVSQMLQKQSCGMHGSLWLIAHLTITFLHI